MFFIPTTLHPFIHLLINKILLRACYGSDSVLRVGIIITITIVNVYLGPIMCQNTVLSTLPDFSYLAMTRPSSSMHE